MLLALLLGTHGMCAEKAVKISIRKPRQPQAPAKAAAQQAAAQPQRPLCKPLIIVGAGALGRRVAALWREEEGDDAPIYAITRAPNPTRDEELESLGIIPCLKGDRGSKLPSQCAHIVFCAPPGITDASNFASLFIYPGNISPALGIWDNEAEGASFVFTSSAGVYAESDGGVVTEESPAAETLRGERLLAAERLVAECGGTVLRLSGLYDLDRGAHKIYLSRPSWPADSGGLINQLHYDDAASAVMAALRKPSCGETFLISDDQPMGRKELCKAALGIPAYSHLEMPTFTGDLGSGGIGGKICDSTLARKVLGWAPRFPTFSDFVEHERACSTALPRHPQHDESLPGTGTRLRDDGMEDDVKLRG